MTASRWLRHDSLVTDEFPSQRPVTRCFDVFFNLRLNNRANNRDAGDLRRYRAHYDVILMNIFNCLFSNTQKWSTINQLEHHTLFRNFDIQLRCWYLPVHIKILFIYTQPRTGCMSKLIWNTDYSHTIWDHWIMIQNCSCITSILT